MSENPVATRLQVLDEFLEKQQETLLSNLKTTEQHDERCMIHARIEAFAFVRRSISKDITCQK